MSNDECKKRCKSESECDNSCIGEDKKPITLAEVIRIIEAEPETISSSQSFRQGYVWCVRDKVKLLIDKFENNNN